jgi:hypothetical protein
MARRARPKLSLTELRVLRDIHGNGGMKIKREIQRRAAGELVLLGYARRLKTKYAITAAGTKLLAGLEPQNPYGDTGAW